MKPKNIIPTVNNRTQKNVNWQINLQNTNKKINLKYGELTLEKQDKKQTNIKQYFSFKKNS